MLKTDKRKQSHFQKERNTGHGVSYSGTDVHRQTHVYFDSKIICNTVKLIHFKDVSLSSKHILSPRLIVTVLENYLFI